MPKHQYLKDVQNFIGGIQSNIDTIKEDILPFQYTEQVVVLIGYCQCV